MKDYLIYIFILSIITCLSIYYQSYYLLLINLYFLIILYKKQRKHLLPCLLITLIFLYLFNLSLKPKVPTNKVYTITKVNEFQYYAKNNQATILIKTNQKFNLNATIKLKTNPEPVISLENLNLFNYTDYLKSRKIFYQTKEKDIQVLNKGINKSKNTTKIDNYFSYFYFMDKENIDQKIKNSLNQLAIVHLVVISGFHFNLFYKVLLFCFIFIKKDKLRNIIVLTLLFFYLAMLDFSYPAFRAFLALLIRSSTLNDKLSKINQFALSGLIIILINPLALLSYSFILTFYVSFIILILPSLFKDNILIYNISIFFATIPFISAFNYKISIFAFIYTIIFSPIIILMYTIVLIGKYFTLLAPFTLLCINYFEALILLLEKYNIQILIGYLPTFISLLYLFLFFYCISKSRKYLFLLIIFIIVYLSIKPINGFVTYLNIGQGDCIIIKPFYSDKVMMIDVGQPYKTKTVENIIIPYLNSQRIKEVSLLVITHADADHAGGKQTLIDNFKVKKIIEKKQKIIKFNQFTFIDILHNSKFKDINRNSITLYTRINSLNYLFTGDIDIRAEQEFNKYVTNLPVDILKLAHHGSKTSTSQDFLLLTKPKYAIAQVKKNNSYNHPSPIVVNRLKDNKIKLYTTATNGSITIYFNKLYNYIKKIR